MSTLKLLREASKGALNTVKQTVGVHTDPVLQVYEKLTPADFEHLTQIHGPEYVAQFISDTEARRLRGGRNGTT
jgi:hypothetical protein